MCLLHLTMMVTAFPSIAFSIDIDNNCLAFDEADTDMNGLPDAITSYVPSQFTVSATYNSNDADGELDILISDFAPPLASLPNSILFDIELVVQCTPPANDNLFIPINFSPDPEPSFGTNMGSSIDGYAINGGVTIVTGIPADCNGDQVVNAGDLSATILEIFDGDGSNPADAPNGEFPGSPIGCDANSDNRINAGDIACNILIIFNDSCGSGFNQQLSKNAPPEINLLNPATNNPDKIEVPIIYNAHGNDVATLSFSIDIHRNWQASDQDADEDGIPDSIQFNLPTTATSIVSIGEGKHQQTIEITIINWGSPLSSLEDGHLGSITLIPKVKGQTMQPPLVTFSADILPSFGNLSGESVSGNGQVVLMTSPK